MAYKKKAPDKLMRVTDPELEEARRDAWENSKGVFLNICEELQARRAGDERTLHARVVEVAGKEVSRVSDQLAEALIEVESLQAQLADVRAELADVLAAAAPPEPEPNPKAKK